MTSPSNQFGKPPSTRVYNIRFRRYREWISDDVAEFVAFWVPITSIRGRRLLAAMRQKVLDYERINPGIPRQDAIDDTTTDVIDALVLGEEDDPILRVLISP